ncbi:MAG TPA: hypothetical protein VJV78_39325 [Polyangiales bacterium]|nr:hypothetical protein [Polyangiales bacterium]
MRDVVSLAPHEQHQRRSNLSSIVHACLLVATLIAARAHAAVAPPVPGINWVRLEGAEQCLSAPVLAQRVGDHVRALRFGAVDEAELFVDGWVRPAAQGGWDVHLEVSGPSGQVFGRRDMHFDGERCAVIDQGVALVIAVTLYPEIGFADAGIPLDSRTEGSLDALFGAEPNEPDPEALPTSAPLEPTPAPTRSQRTALEDASPAEPRSWNLGVDVTGFAALGQLPGLSFGLATHVQLRVLGVWPIELGARVYTERNAYAVAPDKGESSFQLLLASLATCPWSWLDAFSVCGGLEAGRLRALPSGFAVSPEPTDAPIVNVLANAVLRLELGDTFLVRTAAELAVPLIQQRFTYRSSASTSGQLYRMPQVALRLELGAGLQF